MSCGGERVLTVYDFGSFRFDGETLQLTHGGTPLKIRPKGAEVLRYLLEHRANPVTKQALLETFWPGEHVSENALFQVIRDVRNALNQGDDQTTYIMTFPKKGYQWVHPLTMLEALGDVTIQTPSLDAPTQADVHGTKLTKSRWLTPALSLLGLAVLVSALFMWLPGNKASKIAPPTGPKARVTVFNFKNLSIEPAWDWLSTAVAEGLRADMNGLAGFQAQSGERTQQLQLDLSLPQGEPFSQEDLRRIYQYSPGRYVVTGSFLLLADEIRIHWYLKDNQAKAWQSGTCLGKQHDIAVLLSDTTDAILQAMGAAELQAKQEVGPLPMRGESLRYFAEGLHHLRRMDAKSATTFFEKAHREDPEALSTQLRLSQAYAQLGDHKLAEAMASKAVAQSADQNRRNQLMARANLMEIQQQWQQAAEPFQALWLMEPNNGELGIRATHILIQAGESQIAQENLAKLQALDFADDPRLDLLAAGIAGIQGDHAAQLQQAMAATVKAESLGARSLMARGYLMQSQAQQSAGDHPEALETAGQAAALFRDLGQFSGYSQARMAMGDIHNERGAIQEAVPYYEEAIEHFQHLGDRRGVAQIDHKLGMILLRQRNFEQAAKKIAGAVDHFRASGSHELASALATYGLSQINLGEYDRAIEAYDESSFLFRKAGEFFPMSQNNTRKAIIYARQGQVHDAIRMFDESAALAKKSGQTAQLGTTFYNLGQLTFKTGQLERAAAYFAESIALEIEHHRPIRLAGSQYRQAQLLFQKGAYEEAAKGFQTAADQYAALERSFDSHHVLLGLGEIHLQHGELKKAQQLADHDFETLMEANSTFYIQNLLFRTRMALAQGQHKQALAWVEQALSPERNGRQTYQLLAGSYSKAALLVALDQLEEAEKVLAAIEPVRIKHQSVFFDMEKGLVAAAIQVKRGNHDLATLALTRLADQARAMGAVHMLRRIQAQQASLGAEGGSRE